MKYLAIIFAIGMSGLLLYNVGLSNAHPIIISAILRISAAGRLSMRSPAK